MFCEMIKPTWDGWSSIVGSHTVKLKLRDASRPLKTRRLGEIDGVISALNLRHTAVNKQFYGIDKTGGIRSQKCNGFADFRWLTNPAQRNLCSSASNKPLRSSSATSPPNPGVLTGPGLTTFTRIPRLCKSRAHERATLYKTTALALRYQVRRTECFTQK
ncbi:Uncharacterised protein [Klebsiella oxytoca]|uniref:Uncharacterized protein n=1 Tax=Klebsiella oxytoca TaxID=571 RepID=A0A6N2Y068_KLEOX